MRRDRLQWLVLTAAVSAVACGQNGGGNAAATASSSTVEAPKAQAVAASAGAAPARPKPHRHGGVAASLFRAANELNLPQPQQATLDTIEVSLKSDDDGVRSAMKAFRADLAAGIKAGKLDAAKLTADGSAVDQAIAVHKAKEAEALESLHALLDTTQRTALVAALRARQGEREGHATEWMRAKDASGAPIDWSKRRVEKLTTDLGLDASQQTQVAAMLTKAHDPPNAAGLQSRWEERRNRVDALLTAFAGDTFAAKSLDLNILPGKTAHEPMDHLVSFASLLLPILRPDQLGKFAGSLDRPFGAGEHGGRMAGAARGPADDIVFPFAEPVDEGQPPAR